eukprot:6347790-Amphidinium_carterae.1
MSASQLVELACDECVKGEGNATVREAWAKELSAQLPAEAAHASGGSTASFQEAPSTCWSPACDVLQADTHQLLSMNSSCVAQAIFVNLG